MHGVCTNINIHAKLVSNSTNLMLIYLGRRKVMQLISKIQLLELVDQILM